MADSQKAALQDCHCPRQAVKVGDGGLVAHGLGGRRGGLVGQAQHDNAGMASGRVSTDVAQPAVQGDQDAFGCGSCCDDVWSPALTNGPEARRRETGAWHHDLVAAVPELRGDRILLNAHTDEDVAAHVAGEDEETARRFGWWPRHSTEQGVRAAYADWARDWHDDGPRRTFAAREPDTGALVGGCELRIRPDAGAEVSYWTHAGKRGRGHARNALTLLAGYAASIGVTLLEAHVPVLLIPPR